MNIQALYNRNKKIVLISGAGAVILCLIFGLLIAKNSNKKTSNTNSNQQKLAQNEQGKMFPYLPAGICPTSRFSENGVERGDYQGKPYEIKAEDLAWINQNCNKPQQVVVQEDPNKNNQATATPTPNQIEDAPPLLLKSIGFNLGEYNAATNTAGDVKFTKTKLMFDQIFSPFGQQDPRTKDASKKNVQPTIVLPLGTKVTSLVDGEVIDVKELYSGDHTIMVAKSKESKWIYETEHINKPLVKVGDTVKGGQIIGEVSNYDSKNTPGFGLVEIGILHSSGDNSVPEHVCPFKYMDTTIKEDINKKISGLYTAWEKYLGKNIYDQESFVSPGCAMEDPANG